MSNHASESNVPAKVTTVGLSSNPKVALAELRKQIRDHKRFADPDNPEDTGYTLDFLKLLERDTPRSTECPTSLPLGDIMRASKAFQLRLSSASDWVSDSLIKDVARYIKTAITEGTVPAVDPLLVMSIGGLWFLNDGHHRHAAYLIAYRETQCTSEIPVRVFSGNVRSARVQAMRDNVCGKIPMDSRSRSEATWSFVKEGIGSHSQIRDDTRASLRNIGLMAKMLRENPTFAEFTWVEAQRGHKLTEAEKDAFGEDREKAEKLARDLRKKMGPGFPYSPRILAMALKMINDGLPEKLLCEWSTTYQTEEDVIALGI